MAKGRMLNRTAAVDKELNGCSVEAHLLFLMSIPHLDRDGLIAGEPMQHLGTALPFRPDFFPRYDDLIQELIDADLVVRYDTNRGRVLFFTGFSDNQTLVYSREGASVFDPPPGYVRTDTGLVLECQDTNSGVTPELLLINSGVTPDKNTLKLSEVKNEVKYEVNGASALTHSPAFPTGFDEFERMFIGNLITAVQERDPRQRFVSGFSLADTSRNALLQIMNSGPILSAKAIDWALDQWEEAKPQERFDSRKTGCVNWLLSTINNSYKPGQVPERKPSRNAGHTTADLDAIFGVDIHGNPV